MPTLSDLDVRSASEVRVAFDPRWAVRSMFGGAVAAVAVRAARVALGSKLPLSEGMFSFVSPTHPGDATIHVRATRAGRRFAGAAVTVESRGEVTMHGTLAFSSGVMPTSTSAASPPPASGSESFGGDVEWHPLPRLGPESFSSWLRATRSTVDLAWDEWACIATDILGPAVSAVAPAPFEVATAFLCVAPLHPTPAGAWLRQDVAGTLDGSVAAGSIDLHDADGLLVARGSQRAVVMPTGREGGPRLVTGFADSAIHSNLFAIN